MVNGHQPPSLGVNSLWISTDGGPSNGLPPVDWNRSSLVQYSDGNENGYQFTFPAQRDAYLHWKLSQRIDPER